MKILVTGGAGFIGSHLVELLLQNQHEVYIADDLSSGKKGNVPSGATLFRIDVRDPNISTHFSKVRFDAVYHLAAQMDVRKSVEDPFFDASVNILGTMRLLDCCREYGVKKFIFSSSGGVMYGECPKPAGEDTPPAPVSPYGISKATAERYIRFYGDFYNLPYTILRYGNVYGPRQDPHGEAGVVAIFCGKVLNKEAVTIYGTGRQERDYVFVKDVAQANLQALTTGHNDIINIGTGQATSVNDLHKRLTALSRNDQPARYADARAGELERNVLNIQRAETALKWKPQMDLDRGLQLTLEYFKNEKSR